MAIGPFDAALGNAGGTLGAAGAKGADALKAVGKLFRSLGEAAGVLGEAGDKTKALGTQLKPALELAAAKVRDATAVLSALAGACKKAADGAGGLSASLALVTKAAASAAAGVGGLSDSLSSATKAAGAAATAVNSLTAALEALFAAISRMAGRSGQTLALPGPADSRVAPAGERQMLALPGGTAGTPPASGGGEGRSVLAGLGNVAKSAAGAIGAVGGALFAAGNAAVALGQQMGQFVAKANPAAFQQFELVLNDLMATVGQIVLPVFTLLTSMIRTVADAMTLLIPVGAQVAAAIQPLVELLADAMAGALGYLATAMKAVVPVIGVAVRVLMDFVNWIGRLIKDLLSAIGIDATPEKAAKGASVGMAARQAQIGGVEDVLKRGMVSAFGSGIGATDPAKQTASEAQNIRMLTEKFYGFVKNELPPMLAGWFAELPGNLARAIRTGASAAAGAVAAAAPATAAGAKFGPLGAVAGYQVDSLRWLDKQFGTGLFD